MQTHHDRPGLALSLPLHSLGTSWPTHPSSISPATFPASQSLTRVQAGIPHLEWLPSLVTTQWAAPVMPTQPVPQAHPLEENVAVRCISDYQRHLPAATLEAGISMKDVESWGKWFGLLWSAFHPQQDDHHVRCISKEGLNPSLYDLSLEQPKADTLPHHNQLVDATLWGSPAGTFNWSLYPLRGRDCCTPPAGKQSHHPCSGPWHGEMIYLTLSDNIDYSADSVGPYHQGDPPSEFGLIGHHQEYCIFIISCDAPHLHMQDDKPEWTSTFPA